MSKLAAASGMGPVGFAVSVGFLIGSHIYFRNREPIHNAVKTVVINPIVRILSAPKMIYDAITDANQPAVNEVKPFPLGDAQPRPSYSYKCVVSQTPDGCHHLEWKIKPNSKRVKRKDDDDKNDKDPNCRECIPSTDDDLRKLLRLMEELSDLLEIIRLNILARKRSGYYFHELVPSAHHNVLVPQNDNERVTLFTRLIELLEELIHIHGAVFERSEMGIELIPFRVNQMVQVTSFGSLRPPKIILDREIQDFLKNMLTIISMQNLENNLNFRCIIYCIQCQICRGFDFEFHYVGQSINTMNDRGKKHFKVIKTNRDHPLHIHLRTVHNIDENEITKDFLPHAYKIYLIHKLENNPTSPRASPSCKRETDARIRRAWEMFYQWAFKAMHFDGGACRR